MFVFELLGSVGLFGHIHFPGLSHEWVTFYLVSSELVWTELLLLFDHKNNQDQNCCVYKYNYATLSWKLSNWLEFAGHVGTAAELLSALLLLALSFELSWIIHNQNAKKRLSIDAVPYLPKNTISLFLYHSDLLSTRCMIMS